MDLNSLTTLFDDLAIDNLFFGYSGSFSDSITEKLIEISEHNLESHENMMKLRRKISFLMAECYQNIVRHGTIPDGMESPSKASAFFFRNRKGVFYITSINNVENVIKETLSKKLDRVNDLSPDELKELYCEVLQKGSLSEKGGAGLGIIEMARKSGNRLDYLFEDSSESLALFFLHLRLRSQAAEEGGVFNSEISVDEMKELNNGLAGENVLIIHKGDFSRESVLPVIKMIEGNLKEKSDMGIREQVLFHISVEILQNMSVHGYKKELESEGMFLLSEKDGQYILSTVNYIEKTAAESLDANLKELKGMSWEELDRSYRMQLRKGPEEDKSGAGIGLIDVLRKCRSYKYKMTEEGEIYKFSQMIII